MKKFEGDIIFPVFLLLLFFSLIFLLNMLLQKRTLQKASKGNRKTILI